VGDRECWTIIQPFFKEEFATESDDKLILDGLAHMAMHPTENIRDFFGWLHKVNTIILDATHLQNRFRMPMAITNWLT
jgi:hypothetical protein